MTSAQLDSLRLENHFLKQACDSKPNDREVIELKKNFEQSEVRFYLVSLLPILYQLMTTVILEGE